VILNPVSKVVILNPVSKMVILNPVSNYFKFDTNDQLSTRLYDKGDDFNIAIINLPHHNSNIPHSLVHEIIFHNSHSTLESHLTLYAWLTTHTLLLSQNSHSTRLSHNSHSTVVKYKLVHERMWYITIMVWKINNGNIKVVSFVIKSGRKLIISVKFEVTIRKWDRGSCFCCLIYLKLLGLY
jgi:hypothetical protein